MSHNYHPLAAPKLKPVVSNDPGLRIIRHADAGYDIAKDYAGEFGLEVDERLNYDCSKQVN